MTMPLGRQHVVERGQVNRLAVHEHAVEVEECGEHGHLGFYLPCALEVERHDDGAAEAGLERARDSAT